jgi:hypothetical protein
MSDITRGAAAGAAVFGDREVGAAVIPGSLQVLPPREGLMMCQMSSPKKTYVEDLKNLTTSVCWQLDDTRAVWEFDSTSQKPPKAGDWFFLVNFPRTGSTVATHILNSHRDVYCGNEHQTLPLLMTILGSKLFMSPELWFAVRYTKQLNITPRNMRHLLEGWRKCISDKPIFGDKGEMYFSRFGAACAAVFPECKFILTVRNPLDTISSYLKQDWSAYLLMGPTKEHFFRNVQNLVREMLEGNAFWRDRAEVIEFEQLASRDGFTETFERVFHHLGVDPGLFNRDAGWTLCRHAAAIGRGKQDPVINEFLTWLAAEDNPTYSLITDGVCYAQADRTGKRG